MSQVSAKGSPKRSRKTKEQRTARAAVKAKSPWLYLSRAILLLAGLVLFFPLVVSTGCYYPYIFLKSILFRAAVELMLVLYVALAAACPPYRPRFNRLILALLSYFAVMLISSLPGVSVSAWNSWWGDFGRMDGMITQLHLLAYFIILTQTIKRERDWLILFSTSLFFGLLMGLSGLLQELHVKFIYPLTNDLRLRGATGNANFYATHMLLSFFITLWFMFRKDGSELYPLVAKVWLTLLVSLDVLLVGYGLLTLNQYGVDVISTGVIPTPVVLIAAAVHVYVLAWSFLRRKTLAGSIILALLACFLFLSMYLSQTRGAMIGALVSVVLASAVHAWRSTTRRVKLALSGLILLVILSSSLLLLNRESSFVRSHPSLYRLASTSLKDPSVEFRLLAWKGSARGMLDRPLFGWGVDNYRNAFDRYFPAAVYRTIYSELWADRAHNIILDVGATTGLLGLATYSFFFGSILVFLARRWVQTKQATDSLALTALILAYLFQSLSTFDSVNTDGVLYLILAYVSCLYSERPAKTEDKRAMLRSHPILSWKVWAPVGILAGTTLLASREAVYRPYEANRALLLGVAWTKITDPQTHVSRVTFSPVALNLFQQASDYQTTGRYEARQEFANYASDLAQVVSVPLDRRMEVIRKAVEMLDLSVSQDPRNSRNCMYRASLVNRTLGVIRQSDPPLARTLAATNLSLLDRAAVLSPTRPQVYFERGETLAVLGRTDEAITALEKGVSLSPPVKEPNVDLLCLYISAGRFEEAAKQQRRIKDLALPLARADYDRIISVYNERKQYTAMAELYREQLAGAPDDVTLLPRLAATYRALGETELARQTALRAAALSPQIAAELQSFLATLDQKKQPGSPRSK
jgi:O-antigen ligase/Flp pilus assembly protein TadD